MTDDKVKLMAHRAAIRDQIGKFEVHTLVQDKDAALETIQRIQSKIDEVLSYHEYWERSWEDDWTL